MASPRPVPLARSRSGLWSWANSSKIEPRASGLIPRPVSRTERTSPEAARPGRDANLAGLGELHGVGREVLEDPRDLVRVRDDLGPGRVALDENASPGASASAR